MEYVRKPQFVKGDLVRRRRGGGILVVEDVFPDSEATGYNVLCRLAHPQQPGELYDDSAGINHETILMRVPTANADAIETEGSPEPVKG